MAVGDLAQPGQPLLTIYNPNLLQVEGEVNDSYRDQVRLNEVVQVSVPAVNWEGKLFLTEIFPISQSQSRTFKVRTGPIRGEKLVPGMFARLSLPLESTPGILIPQRAVHQIGQLSMVEVLSDNRSQRRQVKLGRQVGHAGGNPSAACSRARKSSFLKIMDNNPEKLHLGLTARLVRRFLESKVPTLIIIISLLAGAAALTFTPREEDPQITVPMVDILIKFPGASPEEVENLAVINLEKKLWEMEGLEDLYSLAGNGYAVVTAKFKVGENLETSLFKVYNKLYSNIDEVPSGVTGWVIKPMNINDVPIVTLTLYSNTADDYELRRVADELLHHLQAIPDAGRADVVAGRKRQVRVVAEPARLAGHGLDLAALARAIETSNVNVPAGRFSRQNREYLVESGPFLKSAEDVANLVVGLNQGRPVYVRDVAQVVDGPEEPVAASTIAFGPAEQPPPGYERGKFYPAVTIAIAKRLGTNAVTVAQGLLDRVSELQKEVIPPYMQVKVTRDYGETANEKVNELVRELLIAVLSITVLLTLFLGWRQALIVALAVPLTLSITLAGNMLFGYTINRVTLFALILSLGLLVDDPIIDVENIHRHFQLREHPPLEATLVAVDEVRAPTILATFTVIISFIPMYFVTGMMGPYMRPMPLNVPLAMLMSLFIAFTVTPWATYHMLKKEYGKARKAFCPGGDLDLPDLYAYPDTAPGIAASKVTCSSWQWWCCC